MGITIQVTKNDEPFYNAKYSPNTLHVVKSIPPVNRTVSKTVNNGFASGTVATDSSEPRPPLTNGQQEKIRLKRIRNRNGGLELNHGFVLGAPVNRLANGGIMYDGRFHPGGYTPTFSEELPSGLDTLASSVDNIVIPGQSPMIVGFNHINNDTRFIQYYQGPEESVTLSILLNELNQGPAGLYSVVIEATTRTADAPSDTPLSLVGIVRIGNVDLDDRLLPNNLLGQHNYGHFHAMTNGLDGKNYVGHVAPGSYEEVKLTNPTLSISPIRKIVVHRAIGIRRL